MSNLGLGLLGGGGEGGGVLVEEFGEGGPGLRQLRLQALVDGQRDGGLPLTQLRLQARQLLPTTIIIIIIVIVSIFTFCWLAAARRRRVWASTSLSFPLRRRLSAPSVAADSDTALNFRTMTLNLSTN